MKHWENMEFTNKSTRTVGQFGWQSWVPGLQGVTFRSVLKCAVLSLAAVGSSLPLVNSLLNLKTMARFPMPDRMSAAMAHDFVKAICLDGVTATISAFILGACLAALLSALVQR